MAKYRRKPIIVEAEKYREGLEDGFDTMDIIKHEGQELNLDELECLNTDVGKKYPYIRTLEGKHYIHKGSYIITGIAGERYPCKPDIFEATYEKVEEGLKNHVKIKREKNKYSIVINGQEINKIIDYKLNVAHNYTNLTITIDVDELDVDLQ
jgi:hypothetical protein